MANTITLSATSTARAAISNEDLANANSAKLTLNSDDASTQLVISGTRQQIADYCKQLLDFAKGA